MGRWRGLVLALALALPPLSHGRCQVGSFEIPVTMSGLRAVATLRVNGTPVPMTVDSGASFSVLTEATAEQLQLRRRRLPFGYEAYGLTGRVNFQLTEVAKLGFQNAELSKVEFLVGGNEPGGGTMGLMGRNLLAWSDAEYDIANGAIRIMVPKGDCDNTDMAYWAGNTPVAKVNLLRPRDERFPTIRVPVKINDQTFTAVLDTGATSILSRSAARRAGMLSDEKAVVPAGKVWGVGQGELPSWLVPMASFEIGGERIANSRLRIADFSLDDADMLIGIDFFLSHRLYVAYSQRQMYFTYHGGPVFDLSTQTAPPVHAPVAEAEPADAAAYARRASAFAARQDLARALADLDRACALDPATASHFRQRARVRILLRQYAEAMGDLDTALRLDPADAEARLERVRGQLALRRTDPALEDLHQLDLTIAPQSSLRREMGQIYLALDRPLLALAQFDAWIANRREQMDVDQALNARCWARALMGTELDKALADCNAAIKARPQEASYLDSRGLVHLRQGRFDLALADYDAALALAPRQAWSLLGRGLARLRLDQREPGLADVAAARAIRPGIEVDARRHGLELP